MESYENSQLSVVIQKLSNLEKNYLKGRNFMRTNETLPRMPSHGVKKIIKSSMKYCFKYADFFSCGKNMSGKEKAYQDHNISFIHPRDEGGLI